MQAELGERERAERQVHELAQRTRLIVDAAQDAYVEVFCFYALNPNTAYTGTVTVQ